MNKNGRYLAELHEVFNQPPDLKDYNCYKQDLSLQEILRREGVGWAESMVESYGKLVSGDLTELGFTANENKPELRSHDRFGHRVDHVVYHPAYHQLMASAIESGWPTLPWRDERAGAHVARAAMEYMHHQAESGTGCPLTMSFAAIPLLREHPDIAGIWESLMISTQYDDRNIPYFDKQGATMAMGMTEIQGGTDVRANTTQATFVGTEGRLKTYEIAGHKWFLSAPMSDAFMILAQTDKGLSCFLLPRWRPDGSRNQLYIQRLKNKLGNHSNASGEVEFRGALAWLLGEEGRGVNTIIEMVALTRFDCIVASAGLMRQAVVQALHHCSHRKVVGKTLTDHPLMRNVLADLVIENEAALIMAMRVARAVDNKDKDVNEGLFFRMSAAIGKYWVCKRAPVQICEAMECLGGAGYIEESILPRLYREAPVNSIWEGSGNVQCLDVLRTMEREKGALDVFVEEIKKADGAEPRFSRYLRRLETELAHTDAREYRARRIIEHLALALQGSLLLRFGADKVAEAFCESRLADDSFHLYGTGARQELCKPLLDRAWPGLD